MPAQKINDTKLIQYIDRDGLTQVQAAKNLGVTKQAVNTRLKQLRGRTTKAIVVDKIDKVLDNRIDAMAQLGKINTRANELLDECTGDPTETVRIMAEIRQQLRLQLDMFALLYDMQASQAFQDTVLTVIGRVDQEVRKKIIIELNSHSAIRGAVKFR